MDESIVFRYSNMIDSSDTKMNETEPTISNVSMNNNLHSRKRSADDTRDGLLETKKPKIAICSLHQGVKLLAHSWGKVVAIHPAQFLTQLLTNRNYDCELIAAEKSSPK